MWSMYLCPEECSGCVVVNVTCFCLVGWCWEVRADARRYVLDPRCGLAGVEGMVSVVTVWGAVGVAAICSRESLDSSLHVFGLL